MRPSKVLRARVSKRVIVTLGSGESFSGRLHAIACDGWVLREARALGAGEHGAAVPVDGELVVLVGDIAYVQVP